MDGENLSSFIGVLLERTIKNVVRFVKDWTKVGINQIFFKTPAQAP